VARLRGAPLVAMVQTADLWNGHDRAERWWRDRSGLWRVLGQREMRPRPVVVGQVPRQDASQADFIQDDHMIETLASNGADDAFRVRVLPRGTWCGEDLMDAHSDRRLSDPCERLITITNEIPRGFIPRKRLAELLGGPRRRGMGGDRHVHDAATLMRQNDQHEEESTRGGGHDEEIGGCDLVDMIREKRPPRL